MTIVKTVTVISDQRITTANLYHVLDILLLLTSPPHQHIIAAHRPPTGTRPSSHHLFIPPTILICSPLGRHTSWGSQLTPLPSTPPNHTPPLPLPHAERDEKKSIPVLVLVRASPWPIRTQSPRLPYAGPWVPWGVVLAHCTVSASQSVRLSLCQCALAVCLSTHTGTILSFTD